MQLLSSICNADGTELAIDIGKRRNNPLLITGTASADTKLQCLKGLLASLTENHSLDKVMVYAFGNDAERLLALGGAAGFRFVFVSRNAGGAGSTTALVATMKLCPCAVLELAPNTASDKLTPARINYFNNANKEIT